MFEKASGEDVVIAAEVTAVRTVRRDELTDQDAARDGVDSLAQLQAALDRHYPQMPGDSPVDIVDFELRRP